MVDGSATAMPPVELAVTMDTIGADMLPTPVIADPAVANEPAATANAAPEVASSAEGSSKDPLRPNFGKNPPVQWAEVDHVTLDPAAGRRYDRDPRFNWAPLFGSMAPHDVKNEVDYVKLMLPMHLLDDIVAHSNDYIAQQRSGAAFTKFQFLRFIGVRVVHATEETTGFIQSQWSEIPAERSCLRAPCYRQRFHLPRSEFDTINSGFRLDDFVEGTVGMVSSLCCCTSAGLICKLRCVLLVGPIQTHSQVL